MAEGFPRVRCFDGEKDGIQMKGGEDLGAFSSCPVIVSTGNSTVSRRMGDHRGPLTMFCGCFNGEEHSSRWLGGKSCWSLDGLSSHLDTLLDFMETVKFLLLRLRNEVSA